MCIRDSKNLVSNDTFDGEAATLGEGANVTLATVDTWPSSIELDPLTGAVTISADVAPGDYKLEYQICDANDPKNCDTAVVELALDAPPVAPAFPIGGGLSSSVCEATPATNAFQDIGLRWTYNQNGGTSPNAEIDRSDIFASANPAIFSGVDGRVNVFDLNLNADQIPFNFNPNVYFEYQFTTQDFKDFAELTGFGATVFEATQAHHVQDTGAYHMAVAIDDDKSFASPHILISDVAFDGVDVSAASASTGPSDTGQYIQNFAHWDANGDVVSLKPQTTYKLRVYPYGDTRNGRDNGQPFNNVVIFDDFMPKVKSCAAPEPTQQPSLSMEKVADSEGPFTVGDVITYTYTVTNDGDTIIRDVAITDTHNGSDPAPVPGDETLFADNGTSGDSTDAAIDGTWDVLAPGDTITFTGSYTVTLQDAANL